ncbi:putative uridine kinase C227.14 isoform X2 [Papaver somniferum]|uniref:putative uridine kinase C227.14 isoform X2 n=1 Tax=Papaver somniferum TaxID=3469 RepID=UPI000E6F997C|nr:putative uridine kinase C227.14 isoform X2 [Papaver somniferum]
MEISSFSKSNTHYFPSPPPSSSSSACRSDSLLLFNRRHFQCRQSYLSTQPIRIKTILRLKSFSPAKNRFKVSSSQSKETPVLEARYIVGIAGPPGAGKSTVASEVTRRINKQWPQKASGVGIDAVNPPDFAIVLPMDGFHLFRHQLDKMENSEEAHARRGAPWTFDQELLLKCLRSLRIEGSVYAPSFDHGVGDPIEDDIFVTLQHKLVIVEGNYLLLEEGAWKEVSSVFDEKWFIDIDIDTAMQRVLKRHISTGKPPDVAKWRIDYNDRPNAELINKSKKNADLIIRSVDL